MQICLLENQGSWANGYVLEHEGHVLAVDPTLDAPLPEGFADPELIVLTHGHFDHLAGSAQWKERYPKARVLIHAGDAPKLTSAEENLSSRMGQNILGAPANELLQDGQILSLGGADLRVIHTPGHTPGCICLYTPGLLISGDTLFAGSVGRSDLPGGNAQQLYASILEKLYVLPDETAFYPGHGPSGILGREKTANPFVRVSP